MTYEQEAADALAAFATVVHEKLSSPLKGHPEDQLKGPVSDLLVSLGDALNLRVSTKTESPLPDNLGRPDVGLVIDGVPGAGYIELKSPGTGADPRQFSGHNREQWDKFKQLPNLLYTDGTEWGLYRGGERTGLVTTIGDVPSLGPEAIDEDGATEVANLLRQFLIWEPVIPTSPRALAEVLAPICRLLRDEVKASLLNRDGAISQLARDWRASLFPEADDAQFSDAYAQTLTYALLLARLDGAEDLRAGRAAEALDEEHGLLAEALRLLTDREARSEIETSLELLERIVAAVDSERLAQHHPDPWLYFYEDFLAEYDPALREERGVYYTPVEVVRCQVRLVAELLTERLERPKAYADDGVVFLDPAAGTGTYPLTAISHAVEHVRERYGPGAISPHVTKLAENIHAFEILVGPYAVAHLRLTQAIREAGGRPPTDGAHVYLTDTLEPIDEAPSGQLPLVLRRLSEEHERARRVKAETPVLVCMGNPPYSRQAFAARSTEDTQAELERLLGDFLELARDRTMFSHLASLYNDYVYFWRWALWKVFETQRGPGIVSFITASSYLDGPGFLGMREVLRRTLDELWIIDLEGSSLGARKTENIFAIRTPVAIAVGVRYGEGDPDTPAEVKYTRFTGSRRDKLKLLGEVSGFDDVDWTAAPSDWTAPLVPEAATDFTTWPRLIDIFPWQQPGMMLGRTWPIATTEEAARERWEILAASTASERPGLFVEGKYGRTSTTQVQPTVPPLPSDQAISEVTEKSPAPPIVRCAWRSFDRQWLLADPRLINLQRPQLWWVWSDDQVYMTSLLTGTLGEGPGATVTAYVPDKHHFSGRGGKDVVPLWRDPEGTHPNVTPGLIEKLATEYETELGAEDLFSYCYALLNAPTYTSQFSEELRTSSPRIPITRDAALFAEVARRGRRLIWLHTFGDRFIPNGRRANEVPQGIARAIEPVPVSPDGYPREFSWDGTSRVLSVGAGTFAPVAEEVWEFEVSGLKVVQSWLGYRMREPSGRTRSELDQVLPHAWPAQFTDEVLDLLWTLEHTIDMYPDLQAFLDEVRQGEVIREDDLPHPSEDDRLGPDFSVTDDPNQTAFPLNE